MTWKRGPRWFGGADSASKFMLRTSFPDLRRATSRHAPGAVNIWRRSTDLACNIDLACAFVKAPRRACLQSLKSARFVTRAHRRAARSHRMQVRVSVLSTTESAEDAALPIL